MRKSVGVGLTVSVSRPLEVDDVETNDIDIDEDVDVELVGRKLEKGVKGVLGCVVDDGAGGGVKDDEGGGGDDGTDVTLVFTGTDATELVDNVKLGLLDGTLVGCDAAVFAGNADVATDPTKLVP